MFKSLFGFTLCAIATIGSLYAQELSNPEPLKGNYWFDSKPDYHIFSPGYFEVSTAELDEGFHTISAYISDGTDVSVTHTRLFYKTGRQFPENEQFTCNIYIDGQPYSTEKTYLGAGGIIGMNLDLNDVDLGMHALGIHLLDGYGNTIGFRNSVFMRVPTELQSNSFKAYYYLDNKFCGITETDINNSAMHLDIDASALEAGIHSVTLYLVSPYAMASNVRTAWFIRIPEGGEGVKQYTYWLNDNASTQKTVILPEATNPYGLVTLIDVPEQPLRSASYTFAIEDNAPVYYACNDFNIRFIDPDQRVSMASRSFTDTRVKSKPEEIISLATEEHLNIGSIPSNGIKLYKFDGEIGDSINLSISHAAMFEVYSPTATPLIKNSGIDATKNNTFTLRENGVYYVALHDIAGGNSATIDFQHIHKFAIIEQNISKTANRGIFEMKVRGNGFNNLASLYLSSNGNEYKIDRYNVLNNNTLYAVIDLDEMNLTLGNYKLKGIFRDSNTEVSEEILSWTDLEVETSTPLNITVDIETPRIASTPYLAYIHVTNHSNVGVWGIPFNIAAQHPENGGKIDFINFEISINQEYKDSLPVVHKTEDLLNTGKSGSFAPTVIPYLGPGETNTYTIGLTTAPHEIVSLYAWTGTPWSETIREMLSDDFNLNVIMEPFEGNLFTFIEYCKLYYQLANQLYTADTSNISIEGMRAPMQVGAGEVANAAAGSAKQAVGTAASRGSGAISTRMTGRSMLLEMTGYNEYVGQMQNTDAGMLLVGNDLMAAGNTQNNLIGNAESLGHLLNARNNWQRSVPPRPHPPVTPVDCYQSADPNDIKGYVSPGGTNYIGIDVKNVTYTIEFENDPEIANAPASTIKVTCNIDGSYFNLSTLRANKLKIGEKEIELPQGHHFVRTLDMRPSINSIAELSFDFDQTTGQAKWELRSLDPLTLNPAKYMDDGILPVNDSSNRGEGYLTFSVDLLTTIADKSTIETGAEIIFDTNPPIPTPIYTNVTDFTTPTARIVSQSTEDNKTFDFTIEGSDTGSGIWYYDLYMCHNATENWVAVLSQIDTDTFTYLSPEALDNVTFTIVATDKAGNRQKNAAFDTMIGDVDGNGLIDANDVVVLRNYYLGHNHEIIVRNADVNNDGIIDTQDATGIRNLYLDNQLKIARQIIKIVE